MPNLIPPIQGLQRRFDLQSQPPYTTPDCNNVVPVGATRRARIARRPGFVRAFSPQLGTSGDRTCDLLTSMNLAPSETGDLPVLYSDDFTDYNTDNGNAVGNAMRADLPTSRYGILTGEPPMEVLVVYDEAVTVDDTGLGCVSVLVDDELESFDESKPYTITVTAGATAAWGVVAVSLYALLDNTTPEWSPGGSGRGVRATLTLGALVAAVSFTDANGNVSTNAASTYPRPGIGATFALRVTPGVTNDEFEILLNGEVVHTATRPTQTSATKRRIGFGIRGNEFSGFLRNESISRFTVSHRTTGTTAANPIPRILVAAAAGKLYREREQGVLEELTLAEPLAGSDLQAAEWGGRLYITDGPSEIASGASKTVTTVGVLTDTGAFTDVVNDWHVVRITDSSTGAAIGTFNISAHTDDTITLEGYTDASSQTVDYVVYNAVKEFDPQTDTIAPLVPTLADLAPLKTKGLIPDGIELIARYNDRIVMAADRLWYMSRAGDPYDWDFGAVTADDPTKAVAATVTEAGRIGEPIKALITHSDDYMIFACDESCYILRGDPGWYGRQGPISHHVGIVHRNAWCATPEGGTLMLSRFGLYYIAPGGAGTPQAISEDVLPDELRNLDTTTSVHMAYDVAARGVWILRSNTGFFFDWALKGWWPLTCNLNPTQAHRYVGLQSDESGVIVAHDDGWIRRWKPGAADDDGEPISAYCLMGPLRLGRGSDSEGIIKDMRANLAESSDEATWAVQVGNAPEAAVTAETFTLDGTWEAGHNRRTFVRARGAYGCVRISGSDNWELDGVHVNVVTRGRNRG